MHTWILRTAPALALACLLAPLANAGLPAAVDQRVDSVMPDVVTWRRDFHQHPELSNQEFRTAGIVAEHLRGLGMEVREGIAHTGVIGVLRGGDGPTVALRADMDALPVEELVDLPRVQGARGIPGPGRGGMHACGHDNHVAILMGVAEVLAGMGDELPGTVLFIFQPAEEGTPDGSVGGAELMLAEGAFDDPRPDVVFGLHVFPFRHHRHPPGRLMASSDSYKITVRGKQTHGAVPGPALTLWSPPVRWCSGCKPLSRASSMHPHPPSSPWARSTAVCAATLFLNPWT